MKKLALALLVLAAAPLAAEEWKNVVVVDTMCLDKVKADPDKHTKACLLQCSKSGYGLVSADGKFLKFDAAGNQKTEAALKASSKTDHLRATVTGERDGDSVKVSSVTFN